MAFDLHLKLNLKCIFFYQLKRSIKQNQKAYIFNNTDLHYYNFGH